MHLGPFRYCMKLGAKWAEMVKIMQKFAPRSCVRIFRNECTRSTPWTLKLCFVLFRSVWVHFGPFRTRWVHLGPFYYLTKLISKRAQLVQLMQKCVLWSRVGIFHNECARSTPLYPKLMLWCVSYILYMFWTIWLQHETRCKMGQTGAINAKVRSTKASRNSSQRMHLIHPIRP